MNLWCRDFTDVPISILSSKQLCGVNLEHFSGVNFGVSGGVKSVNLLIRWAGVNLVWICLPCLDQKNQCIYDRILQRQIHTVCHAKSTPCFIPEFTPNPHRSSRQIHAVCHAKSTPFFIAMMCELLNKCLFNVQPLAKFVRHQNS